MNMLYNEKYLEYVAENFTKKLLDTFEDKFIKTGELVLTLEQKESFVRDIIKGQFNLVEELKSRYVQYGDIFITFFTDKQVEDLYICYQICGLLGYDKHKETKNEMDMLAQTITEIWERYPEILKAQEQNK